MVHNFKFVGKIRVAYGVALALLVGLQIGAYILLSHQLAKRQHEAELVNIIGQQRMWSQRITLLASRLAWERSPGLTKESRQDLHAAMAQMRANHARAQVFLQDQESVVPQSVRDIYVRPPVNLQQRLIDFLAEAARIAALSKQRDIIRALDDEAVLRSMGKAMLQHYEQVVNLMVVSSEDRVAQLKRLNAMLTLSMILLVIGLVVFIFRPMERRIAADRDNLTALNDTLEQLAEARAAQLIQSEVQAQSVLNTVLDGIIMIDAQGLMQSFNPSAERIFGYTCDEVLGKNVSMLMPEPYHSEYASGLAHFNDTHEARIIGIGREVVGQRKNGSTFPMDLAVSEIEKGSGRGYVGTVRDITERKRIDQMKREFISTVSHELRTPLTSIRGALGLVVGGATGALPDKAKELMTIATNNCDRLVRLINDILDMEKIESGKMDFNMQPVDLQILIQETISANQTYAAQHKANIVVAGELPSAQIIGDRDRLIQVITNLLSNAAKFTPPNGEIHVSLAESTSGVTISVRDEGPGISEEFQQRIFQKFSQADSSDTRSKGGTGLGLNITKAIVERHGGQISFETASTGTTFFVVLPLQPTAEVVPVHDEKLHMLVVEDDVDVAMLLRMILEQEGYAVDVAYSAAQARELLAAGRYTALTLDLLLPGESGMDFMRELSENPDTINLPVVVVSAVAEQGRKELQGATVSVLDWLEKPIDEQRLLQAVSRAIERAGNSRRVLHVEDDPDIFRILSTMLDGVVEIDVAATLQQANANLDANAYALVILDIGLPDGSGLDLLPRLSKAQPPIPVLVFSAQELDEKQRAKVSASFVKSRTDVNSLVRAIRAKIPPFRRND